MAEQYPTARKTIAATPHPNSTLILSEFTIPTRKALIEKAPRTVRRFPPLSSPKLARPPITAVTIGMIAMTAPSEMSFWIVIFIGSSLATLTKVADVFWGTISLVLSGLEFARFGGGSGNLLILSLFRLGH